MMKRAIGFMVAGGLFLALAAQGDQTRNNTANNLNLGTAWVSGTAPLAGDIAIWDAASAAASTLGGNVTWGGLNISAAGGPVRIGGANNLTLAHSTLANTVFNVGANDFTYSSSGTFNISGGTFAGSSMVTNGGAGTKNWSNAGGGGLGSITFNGTLVLRGGTGASGAFSGNWTAIGQNTAGLTQTGAFNLDTGASLTDRGEVVVTEGWGDGTVRPRLTLASLTGFGDFRCDWGNNTIRTIEVNQGADTTFNGRFVQSNAARDLALVKSGSGNLTLSGASTMGGSVAIREGTIRLGISGSGGIPNVRGPLGAGNLAVTKVTIDAGATLDVNGQNDTMYGITMAGTGVGGLGVLVNNGPATSSGNIQTPNIRLSADAVVGGSNTFYMIGAGYGATTLDLAGFALTKVGTNTFFLCNTTVSAGTLTVSNGTLSQYRASDGSAAAFTLADVAGAQLSLSNYNLSVGSLAGGGAAGGNVPLGSGTLTVGALNTSTDYRGIISGSGGITKVGTGTLALYGLSTFSGTVAVTAGQITLGVNAGALGAPNYAVTKLVVSPGGTVDVNGRGDTWYGVTIAGTGSTGQGALVNNGPNTGLGMIQTPNIKLSADAAIGGTANFAMINAGYTADTLDLAGFTLTKIGANTFHLCNTTVSAGSIVVSNGVLTQYRASNAGAAAVTLADVAGAALNLNNLNLPVGSLAGGGAAGGDVILGTGTLTVGALGASTSYRGAISGNGALVKTGTGTQDLAGASTYAGGTAVNAGTLLVNNTTGSGTGSGAVTVNGGTLGGTGTIAGAVTVASGAKFAAGNSVGTNTVGSLTLTPGSTFEVEADGAAVDQTISLGAVDLGGATLSTVALSPPTFTSALILSNATGQITGRFAGLYEADQVLVGGVPYYIHYRPTYVELNQTPTAVVLHQFGAIAEGANVVVRWRTASEVRTAGFDLYRKVDGEWVKVNDAMIAATGAGQGGIGASYAITDAGAAAGGIYEYKLVEVEQDGTQNAYGPYERTASAFEMTSPIRATPEGMEIRWLSREGERYRVLRATDLVNPVFEAIAEDLEATPPENVFVDTNTSPLRVYRIELDE